MCVVTAKDYDFVHPRSSFAAGWACASGLDVRLSDGRTFTRKKLGSLRDALEVARLGEQLGSFTELKRGPAGELLGVGIDWTDAPEAGAQIGRRLRRLARSGRHVSFDPWSSFADVYAAEPDKGRAVRLLKKTLGQSSAAMFIGDSANDNSAFQEAEIAVGVAHGQPTDRLRCDYLVEQPRLAEFLRSLRDHGMDFTPRLPWVMERGK